MKSLLYVRVSSKEQEDGYSLDMQEREGKRYAQHKSFEVAKIWRVSESAWKEEREAFNEMIACAKKHRDVKAVIFDSVDRMTRNLWDVYQIQKLILEYDKEIHFSRSGKIIHKDSPPDDWFMMGIEGLAAKKSSDDTSFKVRRALREKAERGEFPGLPPFGYVSNKDTHIAQPDHATRTWPVRMYELYATGAYSFETLRDKLRSEGIPHKNLHKSAVERILKNPFYYGWFYWKKQLYKGVHEPLIAKSLYDEVQRVIDGEQKPKGRKRNFPYTGLVACGQCGCAITAEEKKSRYVYYHCTWRRGRCGNGYVRQDRLEHLFLNELEKVRVDRDIADRILGRLQSELHNDAASRQNMLASLEAERHRLNGRIGRAYEDHLDGKISEAFWREQTNGWNEELARAEEAIRHHQTVDPGDRLLTVEKLLELSNRLPNIFLDSAPEKRRLILNFVCSNYTLLHVTLSPTWKQPFDLLAKGLSSKEWRGATGLELSTSDEVGAGFEVAAPWAEEFALASDHAGTAGRAHGGKNGFG